MSGLLWEDSMIECESWFGRRRVKKGEVVLASEKRLAPGGDKDRRRGGGWDLALAEREPDIGLRVSQAD